MKRLGRSASKVIAARIVTRTDIFLQSDDMTNVGVAAGPSDEEAIKCGMHLYAEAMCQGRPSFPYKFRIWPLLFFREHMKVRLVLMT